MKLNRWQLAATATALLATALAWVGGPRAPRLGAETTGDAALAASVRAAVADPAGRQGLAVAVVDGGAVRFAGLGSSGADTPIGRDTAFEIGSVTKALTGMLLADMARGGLVRVDQPLRELLPDADFADPDVAGTTLAELASHRSGLPRIRVTGIPQALGMYLHTLRGQDPYAGQDTAWLLSTVDGATAPSGVPTVAYSNYGMAVLGQALAARAGLPYPQLLQRRILAPLGMAHTGFRLDGADPPPGHAPGATAGGRAVDPWTASGYAPAGNGAWSTARDLARLVAALLARTAPGEDATTPRFQERADRRVGYGWFTDSAPGQQVTWHDGGTGGFSSFVGFDRTARRGVVVLANTDRPVADLGRRLLGRSATAGSSADDSPGLGPVAVTVFLSLAGGLGLLAMTARAGADRLRLLSNGAWAIAAPALAYPLGAWHTVPTWVWAVGVGLSAYAAALAVRRWRGAPPYRARHPRLRWAGTVLSLLTAAAALAWVHP